MTPTARFRLRLFAIMTIPFTLFTFPSLWGISLLMGEPDLGFTWAAATAISSGLMYGVFMTVIIGQSHIRGVRALGYAITDESLAVRHTRVLRVPMDQSAAFDRALAAVQGLKGATITRSDRATGAIEAKIGTTMKSWGERIAIEVAASGAAESVVNVSSRPVMKWTYADYGRNLGNVLAIERGMAPIDRDPCSDAVK